MPETTSLFALSPPGLTGMVKLGLYLDTLKSRGMIADWHPGRWESYKKEKTGVRFESSEDAELAAKSWAVDAAGGSRAPAAGGDASSIRP